MIRTGFAFAAYHEIMEILIILLLLSLCEKDAQLKETLKNALRFYRENRDLILSLSRVSPSADEKDKAPRPAHSDDETLRAIDEFLKHQ